MRIAAAITLGLLLGAAPAAAQYNQAPREPRECTRLTNQIQRYEGDIQRGNDLWERAMEQQVERLDARRVERCPQYAKSNVGAKLFAKAVDVAAKAAWKYFTWNY
jgi:hypothetical protein